MEQKTAGWGLVRRRQVVVPTWRGWLLVGCLGSLLAWIAVRVAYPFLAVNDPSLGGVMVIEGWMPDYCLQEAVTEFHRHHYEKVYVSGGPVERGGPLSAYKTLPELAAAVLIKLGLSSNDVVVVASPGVQKDRTYASAIALLEWWRLHQTLPARVNLVSVGPHARRSRLLFEKALGDRMSVGVMALTPQDFDPRHWWRSSEGFRTVTSEAFAYFYARVLFRRPRAEAGAE